MRTLKLNQSLLYALIAGLLAALVVSAFHAVITEPLIDQAIALEETAHEAGPHTHAANTTDDAPIISRDNQKIGLWIGYILLGSSWAVLFGSVYYLGQSHLPGQSLNEKSIFLVAVSLWIFAILPALKYPATPPGVGDPNTIYFRQATYLSLLGIGALGAVLAAAVYWRSKANGLKRWLPSLYVIIFVTLSAILLLPNNPDAMTAPMSLVNNFRVLSVLGLLLFWLVFGVTHRFQLNRFIQ